MRVYDAFETSEKLTTEGRECEITFGGKKIATVWVRPADASLNPDYRREIAEMSAGLVKGGLEDLDDQTDRELLFTVYARAVIVGWAWEDPADKKDPKLKFNEKNAVALFKRAPKFFEGIQKAALRWAEFRRAHEEDVAGN